MNLEYLHTECDALTGFFKQGFEKALVILEKENPSEDEIKWANDCLLCIANDCPDLLNKKQFKAAIK